MSIRRLVWSKDISPQTISAIGIAVYSNLSHVGVLYRVSEKQSVEVLHLRWHRVLESAPPEDDWICWIRPQIAADRADAIAAQCRRIWKCNGTNKITFNLNSPAGFFDQEGNQIKGPAKAGLTCAAFVLATFESARFPLARLEEWPPPTKEDAERQADLLKWLVERTPSATPEDIEAFKKEMGNVRFRPLQVAGAGTSDQFPASYAFANDMAGQIEHAIRSQLGQSASPPNN